MKDKRTLELRNIEYSTEEKDGKKIIIGLIPYDSKSENFAPWSHDGEYEVITRTAFTKTLGDRSEVRALVSHDNTKILGSTKSGTLVLTDTDIGLKCEVEVPNTTYGNDAWETISRGDCTSMSFGFIPFDVETRGNTDYLRSVKLEEVSFCVATPAYAETTSMTNIRSITEAINKIQDKEITEEDKDAVLSLIESLKNLVPQEEPKQEAVEEEQSNEVDTQEVDTQELEQLERLMLECELELLN